MTDDSLRVPGFEIQEDPKIYLTGIPGRWLLKRTTPVWRIKDPVKGFQRIVRESRAQEIAVAVLDQRRTFPNAIVLATDVPQFEQNDGDIGIAATAKFLVVDGQHRLWAQRFSEFEAIYACMVHVGLTEVEMARLFLEINDNQKRVPSSLRWDLVRLVRPQDDPTLIGAAELVYLLATERESPLFQRVDLTGEQPEIQLKQGSLAPGIRSLLTTRSPLRPFSFDDQYQVLLHYFTAIKDLDPDSWGTAHSPLYKARVVRALLRLLPRILNEIDIEPAELTATDFAPYLKRIDLSSLDMDRIKAVQGNAGIRAIFNELLGQVLPQG